MDNKCTKKSNCGTFKIKVWKNIYIVNASIARLRCLPQKDIFAII